MNQHDALSFTLFRYHASTCFGLIFSPSSGGQVSNVAMVLDLLVSRLSAGLQACRQTPLEYYQVIDFFWCSSDSAYKYSNNNLK
jgi:hypothetical protein